MGDGGVLPLPWIGVQGSLPVVQAGPMVLLFLWEEATSILADYGWVIFLGCVPQCTDPRPQEAHSRAPENRPETVPGLPPLMGLTVFLLFKISHIEALKFDYTYLSCFCPSPQNLL